jgi:hypothetical protein
MLKSNENRFFPTLHHHARAQYDCVLAEPLPEGWNHLLHQIQEREAAPLFAHDNQVSEQLTSRRHKRG